MSTLWQRLTGRRRKAEAAFEANEATETASERRFEREGLEGYQADEAAEEHLGGFDPSRLVDDGRPREE